MANMLKTNNNFTYGSKRSKNGKKPPAQQIKDNCPLKNKDLKDFERLENQLRREDFEDLNGISDKTLSSPGPRGYYLLHLGVMNSRPKSVQMLLRKGVDPNQLDSHGNSALTLAISEKEIFDILAECKNMNFEVTNSKGRRPIHDACTYAEKDIVRILLQKGVDVNAQDQNKETPLIYVLKTCIGSPESKAYIVKMLLEYGANCDVTSHKGETLMDIAVEGKDLKILEILTSHGVDPTSTGKYGITPLKKAVMQRSLPIVHFFIRRNIDVNAFDLDMGKSSFLTAIENGDLDIGELLVKAGTQLKKESWLWNDEFMNKDFFVCEQNKRANAISWLKGLVSKPLSLKSQARISLRRAFPNKEIFSLFENVSYPMDLKDYILLEQ